MKTKLFENIDGNRFRMVREDRWARENPEGGDITDLEMMGVWDNPEKVLELKRKLMSAIDAGNFDVAHRMVDALSNYHN